MRPGWASDTALITGYVDAGVTYKGLIPGRDADVAGLGIVYRRLNHDVPDEGAELVLEATYRVLVAPAFILQPEFQIVHHPGGTGTIEDAVVVGLRVDLVF